MFHVLLAFFLENIMMAFDIDSLSMILNHQVGLRPHLSAGYGVVYVVITTVVHVLCGKTSIVNIISQ